MIGFVFCLIIVRVELLGNTEPPFVASSRMSCGLVYPLQELSVNVEVDVRTTTGGKLSPYGLADADMRNGEFSLSSDGLEERKKL